MKSNCVAHLKFQNDTFINAIQGVNVDIPHDKGECVIITVDARKEVTSIRDSSLPEVTYDLVTLESKLGLDNFVRKLTPLSRLKRILRSPAFKKNPLKVQASMDRLNHDIRRIAIRKGA